MTINISVSDLQVIESFKNLTEFDFLPIENDKYVLPYLREFGMDIRQGYEIIAHKHRNKQNKVVTGYYYSGDIRTDNKWRNSSMCIMEDRIIMTGRKDFSLTQELCKLSGSGGITFHPDGDEEDALKSPLEALTADMYEPEGDIATEQIKVLNSLVFAIRGSPYNDAGNLKTHQDWMDSIKK